MAKKNRNKDRNRQQGGMNSGAGRQQAQQSGRGADRQQGGAGNAGRQQSQQNQPHRTPQR